MNIAKIYITAALLMATICLEAQELLNLTLQQCRTMAIENSEVVKIAEENITKAEGQKLAARSAWLPNVSATATGIYNNQEIQEELYLPTMDLDIASGELVPNVATDPSTGFPILGPDELPLFSTYAYLPINLTIYGGAIAEVSAQQPLYAGGKIIAGNKMARIGKKMAHDNKQLKQSEIIYQTDQSYYQYLSVKEKVKLAKEYQRLLKQLVTVVDNSYQTGMTNRNELLKVQVKYNDASLEVQQAETGFALARMSLCRIIGVDLHTDIEINDSIQGASLNVSGFDSVRVTDRIEYSLLQNQVDLAKQNIKMVRGDYMPTAGISAAYNYLELGLENMDNYSNSGFNVMGSIKIPITTFGEKKGKVAMAKADFNIKKLELQQAEEFLHLEIEQAYLKYIDAYTRVLMTQKTLEQANENMRVSDDNYSLGMETIVNLLEAKAEWQKAFSNKIDALADFKVKESNYLRVSNDLKQIEE